ncbi:MAG: PEP-CTERM sorting domain-containing protein [Phycisphaerales bacterium]|nr:PEP-CTERM sorting domain-containing protein [Phycisphaerales bacterium]
MKKALLALAVASVAGGIASSASAQYLMVTNFSSSGRSVMLFNKSNGSLVSQNWIVGDGGANVFNSQTEALSIGSDVWISDQVQNKVFRYNLATGTYKTALTGDGTTNLNNIRGMARQGNTVFVANAGTGFGNSIVKFDANTGAYLGAFAIQQFSSATTTQPWDIHVAANGELLISNYSASNTTGVSRIDRYDASGSFLGNVYFNNNNTGTSLIGPQQINADGSNLLVGGFSGTVSAGAYQLNASGSVLNSWGLGFGFRSVFRLDNGKFMVTKGDGVWILDPSNNTLAATAAAGPGFNAKYISEIAFIPAPGSIALLGLGGLLAARRRR